MTDLFLFLVKPAFAQVHVPPGMPMGSFILWSAFIPGVIQLLLFLAFLFSFIYLLWGGFSWVTSGGNKESLEKARGKVTYAILGLVIALLSFFILYTFGELFGVDLRNF